MTCCPAPGASPRTSASEGLVPVYANFSNSHPAANGVAAGPFYVEVRGPITPREREVQRGFAMSFGAVLVDRAHVDRLRRVVDSDRTPAAAVGSALRTIRAARQTEQGSRLVGERCSWAIVWSERERQPEGLVTRASRSEDALHADAGHAPPRKGERRRRSPWHSRLTQRGMPVW